MEPVLLRIQETAKLLKVSKWTVYRWIEEGRLRATKIGQGSLRVFQASVSGLIGEDETPDRNAKKNVGGTVTRARGAGRKMKK
jgi:excisionase family DNA binding protein